MDDLSEKWPPNIKSEEAATRMPGRGIALVRGLSMRCPACGRASAFEGLIAVRKGCPRCDTQRADDLVQPRPRDPFGNQVNLKRPNIFQSQLIRRMAKKKTEYGNPADIRLLGRL